MTTVFISGSIKIRSLNKRVKDRLNNIINQNFNIIIGDANGADKAVQKYLLEQKYSSVTVFCSGRICRNNIGNWNTEFIFVKLGLTGRDFYTQKDKAMALKADYGFILWDGKSSGSFNNILELLKNNKQARIYYSPEKEFYPINKLRDAQRLLGKCEKSYFDIISRKIKLNSSILEIESMTQGTLKFQ